jgi:hypothetical protein
MESRTLNTNSQRKTYEELSRFQKCPVVKASAVAETIAINTEMPNQAQKQPSKHCHFDGWIRKKFTSMLRSLLAMVNIR